MVAVLAASGARSGAVLDQQEMKMLLCNMSWMKRYEGVTRMMFRVTVENMSVTRIRARSDQL